MDPKSVTKSQAERFKRLTATGRRRGAKAKANASASSPIVRSKIFQTPQARSYAQVAQSAGGSQSQPNDALQLGKQGYEASKEPAQTQSGVEGLSTVQSISVANQAIKDLHTKPDDSRTIKKALRDIKLKGPDYQCWRVCVHG